MLPTTELTAFSPTSDDDPLAFSLLLFASVFLGGMLGMFVSPMLPDKHVSSESRDVVRLGMGLVATTVALVLGLLVASAKSLYDTQNNEVTQLAADMVLPGSPVELTFVHDSGKGSHIIDPCD